MYGDKCISLTMSENGKYVLQFQIEKKPEKNNKSEKKQEMPMDMMKEDKTLVASDDKELVNMIKKGFSMMGMEDKGETHEEMFNRMTKEDKEK